MCESKSVGAFRKEMLSENYLHYCCCPRGRGCGRARCARWRHHATAAAGGRRQARLQQEHQVSLGLKCECASRGFQSAEGPSPLLLKLRQRFVYSSREQSTVHVDTLALLGHFMQDSLNSEVEKCRRNLAARRGKKVKIKCTSLERCGSFIGLKSTHVCPLLYSLFSEVFSRSIRQWDRALL